jgi:hypothetical protein
LYSGKFSLAKKNELIKIIKMVITKTGFGTIRTITKLIE